MKICCLGDSLTEGDYDISGKSGIANVHPENYPYFLQTLTHENVINYGKCGYQATSFLKYYKSGAVDVKDADIIIILLGTNGGLDPDEDTQGNRDYIKLIEFCKADAGNAKIYLCTPPHVTENPEMSNCGYAGRVNKAVSFVRNTAAKLNCPLIDIANCPDFTEENEHIMQPNDGLHFGETGYRTLANFIYNAIK